MSRQSQGEEHGRAVKGHTAVPVGKAQLEEISCVCFCFYDNQSTLETGNRPGGGNKEKHKSSHYNTLNGP